MSGKDKETADQTSDSFETKVADYLIKNPDFFERHLDLLEELKVPHPSGNAISLIERQILQLRAQNNQVRSKLMELVEVARENDRLSERMQKLILSLFDAGDLEDVLSSLREVLTSTFHADRVEVRLFVADSEEQSIACNEFTDRSDPALRPFENVINTGKPVCGRLKPKQLDYMFGEDASAIQSAVLLPLGTSEAIGLLAIGSHDEARFQSGMGTVFLTHMSELIGISIQRFLPTPGS